MSIPTLSAAMLKESTQAAIALTMVGVTVFNVASGRPIPDQFTNMVLLVVGFYFGRASNGTSKGPV